MLERVAQEKVILQIYWLLYSCAIEDHEAIEASLSDVPGASQRAGGGRRRREAPKLSPCVIIERLPMPPRYVTAHPLAAASFISKYKKQGIWRV